MMKKIYSFSQNNRSSLKRFNVFKIGLLSFNSPKIFIQKNIVTMNMFINFQPGIRIVELIDNLLFK